MYFYVFIDESLFTLRGNRGLFRKNLLIKNRTCSAFTNMQKKWKPLMWPWYLCPQLWPHRSLIRISNNGPEIQCKCELKFITIQVSLGSFSNGPFMTWIVSSRRHLEFFSESYAILDCKNGNNLGGRERNTYELFRNLHTYIPHFSSFTFKHSWNSRGIKCLFIFKQCQYL